MLYYVLDFEIPIHQKSEKLLKLVSKNEYPVSQMENPVSRMEYPVS